MKFHVYLISLQLFHWSAYFNGVLLAFSYSCVRAKNRLTCFNKSMHIFQKLIFEHCNWLN